ncbi:Hypothetical predicted protein [Lecanosticta acicola]|uniref:Rhodopsin domain-containing protein n=1 Tax=Lecanosticta acicola TaxID=111012 RepID=A0AAI8W2G7_9PEZI|nr:Hypothetical predicted protein [Lecanosticta acicola]
MVAGPPAHAYGGRGTLILGITWTETTLATIAVILRAYSAGRLAKKAEWDLFWVLIAWTSSFVAQILITLSALYGMGNHVDILTPNDVVQASKWGWIGQIVALFAIGFAKIAVVALLLRMQGPSHVRKKWILHGSWITNLILNVNQMIMILLQCDPVSKIWNRNLPGNCDFQSTTSKVGFLQGSWAAASDIVLASYPIFVFWSLDLSWRRKLGLCALMGGGYIAAIAGIIKTIYIKLITATTDITYAEHPLLIWAYTEMWLIIILGSIPQLRVMFAFLRSEISVRDPNNTTLQHSGGDPDKSLNYRLMESTTFADSMTERESQMLPQLREIVVTNSYSVTHTAAAGNDEEAARTNPDSGTSIPIEGGFIKEESEESSGQGHVMSTFESEIPRSEFGPEKYVATFGW